MTILKSLRFDITLQFKHGFYYAYLILSIFYIVILRLLPPDIKDMAITETIFSDPSVFGLFFMGAMILLEKDQHTFESLFVTPIRLNTYFFSKVISLSLMGLLTSFGIAFFVNGLDFNPLWLFLGVGFTSILFTFIGIIFASRAKNFNHFLFLSMAILFPIGLPLLEYFHLISHPILYLFPSKASLILIDAAFRESHITDILYAIGYLPVWIVIVYFWASRWFKKYVIFKIGGGQ